MINEDDGTNLERPDIGIGVLERDFAFARFEFHPCSIHVPVPATGFYKALETRREVKKLEDRTGRW
jgi:hypothetical protein